MATADIQDLLDANNKYAETHTPALTLASRLESRRGTVTAVVTCMDPRSTPEDFFNYAANPPSPASIRVVGGRAEKALPSLVLLNYLIGLKRIIVVHHTDCGVTYVTDKGFHEAFPQEELKSVHVEPMEDFDKTASADAKWLKSLPYWQDDIVIVGMVYDIETGKVRVVE